MSHCRDRVKHDVWDLKCTRFHRISWLYFSLEGLSGDASSVGKPKTWAVSQIAYFRLSNLVRYPHPRDYTGLVCGPQHGAGLLESWDQQSPAVIKEFRQDPWYNTIQFMWTEPQTQKVVTVPMQRSRRMIELLICRCSGDFCASAKWDYIISN